MLEGSGLRDMEGGGEGIYSDKGKKTGKVQGNKGRG